MTCSQYFTALDVFPPPMTSS